MSKLTVPAWLVARGAGRPAAEIEALASRLVSRTLPDGSARLQLERGASAEVVKNGELYTVAVSDDTLDRWRDVLVPKGVQFDNYLKNPVWLVDHDYSVASIVGRGLNGRVDKNRVLVDYAPDPINSSPATDTVLAKLDSGSLRATSVGFIPIKWEKIVDDQNEWTGGFRYLEWELLENSWVAVPANPNALLLSANADLSLRSPVAPGHSDEPSDPRQIDQLTERTVRLMSTVYGRR